MKDKHKNMHVCLDVTHILHHTGPYSMFLKHEVLYCSHFYSLRPKYVLFISQLLFHCFVNSNDRTVSSKQALAERGYFSPLLIVTKARGLGMHQVRSLLIGCT